MNYIICKRNTVTGVGYYFTVAKDFDFLNREGFSLKYKYKNKVYVCKLTSGKYGLHFTHNYIRYYLQEVKDE